MNKAILSILLLFTTVAIADDEFGATELEGYESVELAPDAEINALIRAEGDELVAEFEAMPHRIANPRTELGRCSGSLQASGLKPTQCGTSSEEAL